MMVAISAFRLNLSSTELMEFTYLTLERPYIYTLWGLPIISGICLLNVRSWSYFLFMAAQVTMAIGPLMISQYAPDTIRFESMMPIYFTQIISLFAIYKFVETQNRKSFFDPSLRWWERSERYHLPIPMSLKSHHLPSVLDTTVLNISSTGIFFINNSSKIHEFQKGEKFLANLSFQEVELSIPLRIVRKGQFEGYQGWGAEFSKKGIWNRIYILKLIKQIHLLRKSKLNYQKHKQYQKAS
jgi:hypothetical protein